MNVSLEISHQKADDVVTDVIGIASSRGHMIGEVDSAAKVKVPKLASLWAIDSQHAIKSDNLADHVAYILTIVREKELILHSFKGRDMEVSMRIYCDFEDTISLALSNPDLIAMSLLDRLDMSIV